MLPRPNSPFPPLRSRPLLTRLQKLHQAAAPSLSNSTVWRGPVTFFAPSDSSLFTSVVVHGIGVIHRGRVEAVVESNFLCCCCWR
ncbi:hypothetical protein RHMOL_Rhmol11G0209400 [Rhododendron molle]|uniref:Uncharacterized protein n=1 Tax=Rhododendron molle TaxID=49168 RepID=A0ACC0LVG9_RHOML|nr:hypothetical protein RHMOL_Rhmol11G0209400 [Rhododendron molle]